MKRTVKLYTVVWLIALALFNVVTFVSPARMGEYRKFDGAFWAGYIFITVAFLGHLVCTYWAFRADTLKGFFYNVPLISISYTGLVLMGVVGTVFMLISSFPNWVGIIVCAIVLAAYAIAVLKASMAVDLLRETEENVAAKTFFIQTLTMQTEALLKGASSADMKLECKKVYEAARYSDPMSHDMLVKEEERIVRELTSFESAVRDGDVELAGSLATELIALIDARNVKCKLLK